MVVSLSRAHSLSTGTLPVPVDRDPGTFSVAGSLMPLGARVKIASRYFHGFPHLFLFRYTFLREGHHLPRL
ncbi:MAG: hypothetical protein Kow0089_21830 [Desulfobulbaceae bacterium]